MKKFGSPLSKELREKYQRKAVRPVKGDGVRIVRGGFKGIEGKITRIDTRLGKVFVEGVSREKIAGGKTGAVPIDSSKVVVTSLNTDDKVRKARIESKAASAEEAA
ncbi:MAG: 50S ribosomal protein L24 [Nitrososphaerota archaeon]|nr:50S ribosomal protein L24 [Nitrososphaerota archaeon]MDG6966727.1 50S ribosomal protein L24 [Nitrososphaerota archaeon]MDG6979212.1 50S ribosomal protein L24 [Nitrososphaerota archaeon]MDG7022338.1 50S ribosomal protein L24 [Nitrososphaerota archaeon]